MRAEKYGQQVSKAVHPGQKTQDHQEDFFSTAGKKKKKKEIQYGKS